MDLTQEQLVQKLGMHKTTYTNYEQGKHSVPLDFAVELANFYNVSLDYIAGLTNEKQGLTKSSLDVIETETVCKLRQLSDIDKGRVLGVIDTLLNK
ncbi:MAG: helix-turn-helix transcriptional regulator [Oscillospiraceae bacterium]|nr:helix-turn-helix transcriptional regulator [Oscillospiraceae bacterium]